MERGIEGQKGVQREELPYFDIYTVYIYIYITPPAISFLSSHLATAAALSPLQFSVPSLSFIPPFVPRHRVPLLLSLGRFLPPCTSGKEEKEACPRARKAACVHFSV